MSFTLDRYGHLMPDDDAAAALSVAALVDGTWEFCDRSVTTDPVTDYGKAL